MGDSNNGYPRVSSDGCLGDLYVAGSRVLKVTGYPSPSKGKKPLVLANPRSEGESGTPLAANVEDVVTGKSSTLPAPKSRLPPSRFSQSRSRVTPRLLFCQVPSTWTRICQSVRIPFPNAKLTFVAPLIIDGKKVGVIPDHII